MKKLPQLWRSKSGVMSTGEEGPPAASDAAAATASPYWARRAIRT